MVSSPRCSVQASSKGHDQPHIGQVQAFLATMSVAGAWETSCIRLRSSSRGSFRDSVSLLATSKSEVISFADFRQLVRGLVRLQKSYGKPGQKAGQPEVNLTRAWAKPIHRTSKGLQHQRFGCAFQLQLIGRTSRLCGSAFGNQLVGILQGKSDLDQLLKLHSSQGTGR